jgi:hypothetical protein
MNEALAAPLHQRRTTARALWLFVALAGSASAVVAVMTDHVGLWPVVVFALAPDLSFLAGAGQSAAPGQLPKNAVPVYNLVHRPLLPIAMMTAASVGLVSEFWLAAGLSWLTHIAADRAVGFGLRTAEGWQRG